MQHFAHITNGIVDQVIVISAEMLQTGHWGDPSEWIETCHHTYGNQHNLGGMPLRKNHACIGATYDSAKDAFILPKPYESWILNEDTCLWVSPTPKPENTQNPYIWDESKLSWVEVPEPTQP